MLPLHRSAKPPILPFFLLVVFLAANSVSAVASEHLLMRATCGQNVVTAGEGSVAGYSDFAELSSVHHELSVPMNTGGFRPNGPFTRSPVRVVKPVSASTVRLLQRMAQGQECEEVLILHLRPGQGPQAGTLVEYWELLLETVYLSERKNWDVTGGTLVQDAISLNPSMMTWTFTDATGSTTEFQWDFETGMFVSNSEE